MAKQVTVGDTTVSIQRFKGFKAVRAAQILARVTEEVQAIMRTQREFIAQYRVDNVLTITKGEAMERARSFRGAAAQAEAENEPAAAARLYSAAESWDGAVLQMGDTEELRLPQNPSEEEVGLVVLGKAVELIDGEAKQLLALILAPNSELATADDEDRVDGYLDERGKALFREADVDQLVDVALAAWETIQEQFAGKADQLGKLRRAIRPTAAEEEETQKPKSSPESSTPSPSPTAGTGEPSSTESPGTSSALSRSA